MTSNLGSRGTAGARFLLTCSMAALFVGATAGQAQTGTAGPVNAQSSSGGATAPSGDQGQADTSQQPGDASAAIVVTGVRASLQSAQSIKRNSPQIVDSIVAEDIGKLPDRNVAEALQRISGIQIQRQYGEGSSVAIRGLTQVRTELNGRDIFTANGANQLSLEDVPSELLAGIDVYKNPSSDLIEDQLSGTINFRTRKPFDFSGFKASASVNNSYYDLVDKSKPSFSGLLSDRWETGIGEIGILADIAYQKTAFREDTISTQPFYTLDPTVPADAATLASLNRTGQTTTLPHGTGIGQHYGDRRRFGTDVAIQWRPSPTLEFTGEVFRNDYKFRFDDYSWFAYSGDAAIQPLPGAAFTYADNGDFQSGTFANVPVNSNTSLSVRHSITTDYSLNAKWKPTDRLTITADGQYVRATTTNTRSIVILNSTAGTLTQDIRSAIPVIGIGPAGAIDNPNNYTLGGYLDDINRSVGSDKAGRVDAEYKFDGGFLSSVKAGFRFADRSNSTKDTGYRYTGLSGPLGQYERVDLTDFFRGDADLFNGIIAFPRSTIVDYDATRAALGIDTLPSYLPSGRNDERQKTYAGYVAAFFKADRLPVPIDGNIGVRIVKTELAVNGFYQQTEQVTQADGTSTNGATTFSPIGDSRSYTKVLPSLNLRGHLTDKLQLRFAASANLARPTFDQLNPSLTLTEPGTSQLNQIHTASGGNPYLKPMTSKNLDLSLEWYFSRTGSLTAAAFYKHISNYIQTAVTNRAVTFPDGQTFNYEVTSYNNVASGKVKGVEVAYQQFFDFLPGLLRGLGVQSNFTYVDSKAPSPQTSGPVTNVPLENLSKYSYNVVGIYELGKISARAAYNWRSKYVQTTAGNGTGSLPIFNKAFGQLDASLTYNVTPHFSLTVDGRNLLNTRLTTYFGLDTRPRDVTIDDRRISGIARITF
ncbi:TonB-dependent receptor [Sphingomonas morindae]|uniref:TonB-dependent receptor n=1 Tax=Sphingomonas morindae TaxID=1541170 RepID=A0ABY4XDJ2_9SPHN|nr:TonB-dependent receptor [Sphingomonas morindae]USI74831.1 TonB-dependent receptor [Sphingomonas morindae]